MISMNWRLISAPKLVPNAKRAGHGCGLWFVGVVLIATILPSQIQPTYATPTEAHLSPEQAGELVEANMLEQEQTQHKPTQTFDRQTDVNWILFELFKKKFDREYNSYVEEAQRMQLFIVRSMRAFVSTLKHKLNMSTYYLRVNHLSDRSPGELRMFIGATNNIEQFDTETVEKFQVKEKGKEKGKQNDKQSELDENERDLFAETIYYSIGLKQNGDTTREQQQQHEQHGQKKFSLDEFGENLNKMYKTMLHNLLGAPNDNLARRPGTSEFKSPLSNNPNYVPLDQWQILGGESSSDESVSNVIQKPPLIELTCDNEPKFCNELKLRHKKRIQNRLLSAPLEFIGGIFSNLIKNFVAKQKFTWPPKLNEFNERNTKVKSDVMWADHRQCLLAARNQGMRCNSCYAFAPIAFYEWKFCDQTGEQVQFSEQFVVDCGPKVAPTHLLGCDGGRTTTMLSFVNKFGLELAKNYPYIEHDRQQQQQQQQHAAQVNRCPVDMQQALANNSTGYLRIDPKQQGQQVFVVPMHLLEHVVKFTPVIINLSVDDDFYEYGGGVHQIKSCNRGFGLLSERTVHTVLLVGHGRENNIDYWLFRNSFSTDYGESGYYKLATRTQDNCFEPSFGILYGPLPGQLANLSPTKTTQLADESEQNHWFANVSFF